MRILFISQIFDPEYSIKGLDLMKHWVDQGHEVEVLTTFPNYPNGRVFEGYSVKMKSEEDIGGVKVVRLWSYISHSRSKLARAMTYLSFTFMALCYALARKKPDVLYAYHPQVTTGFIGMVMKAVKGVPYITDVQDLWPDALKATGIIKSNLSLNIISGWCRLIYKNAAQVVTLSRGYCNELVKRGIDQSKVGLVYNWCPEYQERLISEKVRQRINYQRSEDDPVRLVYAGNIGAAQSLQAVVEAASRFDVSELSLTLFGGGVERSKLLRYIKDQGIRNVYVREYIPSVKIIEVLSECADVLVVHLRNEPLFRITIPSKTQFSLALGKPILMAVEGESKELVVRANAGVIAIPEDVDSLEQAMRCLLNNKQKLSEWGGNAREYYMSKLSCQVGYLKLDTILSRLQKNHDYTQS